MLNEDYIHTQVMRSSTRQDNDDMATAQGQPAGFRLTQSAPRIRKILLSFPSLLKFNALNFDVFHYFQTKGSPVPEKFIEIASETARTPA